jgi:xylulokinase
MRCYLGVDIGTYATKAVLVDGAFRVIAAATVAHGMDNPAPRHFEQDAETVWWGDFCRATQQLLRESGLRAGDIAAVGGDTLGCDCLPVDERCRPLRKAILYGIDARADEEIAFLNRRYGNEGAPWGRPLGSDDIAPKILWIKNHEPDVYGRTHKFLTGSSFITARLTGRYVIDRFLARSSFLPLYREDGSINAGECGLYCRPDQLCDCLSVHEIAGGVTAEAAAATGLAEGTPVICGTGDSTSEAISIGVVKPGAMMMQFGSTLFFYCCSDRPIADPRLHSGVFTVPGTFCVAGGTNTGGTLIRWVRDNFYPGLSAEKGDDGAYQEMARLAAEIPPGSDGLVVLPYFAGERCPVNDPLARGLFFGLTLRHTREHLYHAALEGVGYSMAQNIRIIEEAGLPLQRLTAVGGGTKNALWMQMVADIIGKPFSLPEVSIGGSYGCALMGALGIGDLAGFDELAAVVRPGSEIRPDMDRHETYRRYLDIYGELYAATADLMHRLP